MSTNVGLESPGGDSNGTRRKSSLIGIWAGGLSPNVGLEIPGGGRTTRRKSSLGIWAEGLNPNVGLESPGGDGTRRKSSVGVWTTDDPRMSAEEMDEKRNQNIAYEYLCHLEEAKVWIEACISETLPATTELEEGLMNGVILAKLGHFMAPEKVLLKKIYDIEEKRYQTRGLHFRHTDNINHWLRAMEHLNFPKIFYPETTDIYDRKNMPRVIYCIHALSLYMFKLGLAPQIQDLYGKVQFTDEEISAMRKELEKYGIQMPAFSKIGGILANEMPVDEAALHAAIIAINDAVDHQEAEGTLKALQNSNAHLVNIQAPTFQDYQDMLYMAKYTKAENARNKSMDPDSSYVPDVYDEMLTQAEIQGNVNTVNVLRSLDVVNDALNKQDADLLQGALREKFLGLRDVKPDNTAFYLNRLVQERETKKNNNGEEISLDKEEVQQAIHAANQEADVGFQRMLGVKRINQALDRGEPEETLRALQNPAAQMPEVYDYAAMLYQEEFFNIKAEKQDDLDYDEILGGVRVLSAIAKVNKAIEVGDPQAVTASVLDKHAHIMSADESFGDKYVQELAAVKRQKAESSCDLLTHFEIQETIYKVNKQVQGEHEKVMAVGVINEAVNKGQAVLTLESLKLPAAGLRDIQPLQAYHYQALLKQKKAEKAQELDDPHAALWIEEIQDIVTNGNHDYETAQKMSVGIAAANIAINDEDVVNLLNTLQLPEVGIHAVTPQCADAYLAKLHEAKRVKLQTEFYELRGEGGSGWMMNRTKDGHKFYFNVHTMEAGWEKAAGITKDYSLLTREEMQICIKDVTAHFDRQLLFKANEKFVVRLQSQARGYLTRKAYMNRRAFMNNQIPAIIKLQAWWRSKAQRKKYQDRLNYLGESQPAVIKVQSVFRMLLAKKRYQKRQNFFKSHEDKVIKIQAFFKSSRARQDYRALMEAQHPSVKIVRNFVHLLDHSDRDYSEDIELQKLRQQVVKEIRSNQQLEHDLDTMDIKIGLLVKNRITLQDVVSQNKKLSIHKLDASNSIHKGLKALSKESRCKLEAYQHLFYLLQTNPNYLAKLIFEMPQSKTTKFMESVILTLYNYASNHREEYLLLKLFKTALTEEILSKVDKMSDIVTGNPMVVKMIVGFNRLACSQDYFEDKNSLYNLRSARGQNALRELLNPLVRDVIEDRNLQINTNPIEVYKAWVNQMECQTGKASGMPYDVSMEQALSHEEVRKRINQSVKQLQNSVDKFLAAILQSLHKIPYGMRYMAKVMRDALHKKFPDAPEKDVLKIIGNLLYYRYINSAIVAPDAFDIIDVSASKGLTNDQRRNLGSIAKILQFAASNKGFGGDSGHLASLNMYIMESHEKFKKFFRAACNVEEPEDKFNIDEFTDVIKISKPVIYISIKEICDTHQLLMDHEDTVAPDPNDPLHELLEDLGDAPDMDALIGDAGYGSGDDNGSPATKAQMAKTEISLTLSNKFEVQEDDQMDLKTLFLRTKRMIVDVIRFQSGENLTEILNTPATEELEVEHQALVRRRDRLDQKSSGKDGKLRRNQSMASETRLPLEGMKTKIKKNLHALVMAAMVSHKDHYQKLIDAIARDIRNQRRYRQRRKQEMMRLRSTLQSLAGKRKFFEEQVDYYNQYVKTCLDNMMKGKKKHRKSIFSREAQGSIKYSAAKLYEKGVVLEIEGLPTNQFKNVLFEITATDVSGLFDVNAKFMGVPMEKVEVVFQDLLQLQYEGVAVMKMFDRAKVNVNLLIFLLNKKFYQK